MKIIDYTNTASQSDSFDNHERVSLIQDNESGLQALIAIHNTNLGPAVGGCRMYPYPDLNSALEDVLRLSRGMTYKSAVAGLPMGGGKAVIIGDPSLDKTKVLLEKMGQFIDYHQGRYITAEDSGMNVADLTVMATQTPHVLGISAQQEYGGDPSPLTAQGIFLGIQTAVKYKLGRTSLNGVSVALQGVGSVGLVLAGQLLDAQADVVVCDVNQGNVAQAQKLGATVVSPDEIFSQEVDVFCPCAMGGIINDETISQIVAPIIAGGANNQLALPRHAKMLSQRGILYAPDFVINAGGIIEICRQLKDESTDFSESNIRKIAQTLMTIFEESDQLNIPTSQFAEVLAERHLETAHIESTAA